MTDRATATNRAWRTPKTMTPTIVVAASPTSTFLIRASPRHALGLISPREAEMMTAPSTALGRYCMGAVRNSSTTATTPASISPANCVRPPIWSLTAVREPLAPIGNPWVMLAAILLAPIAASSASAPRERSCGQDRIVEADDEDAQGGRQDVENGANVKVGQADSGQAGRDLA